MLPRRSFLDAPTLSLDDVCELLPADTDVSEWNPASRPARKERLSLLSVGAVGIKPWLRLRRQVGARRIQVVTTDEGLGTYGNWFSRREAWQREGVSEPWLSIRTTAVLGMSWLLGSTPWRLYRRGADGWELNPFIAEEFRAQVRRRGANGKAVFLTQPWPELGVLAEPDYLEHIAAVGEVSRAVGLEFVVHPHPAEPPSRYAGFTVRDGQRLAELDPEVVGASVLLGATSTAMVNIAAIHGVPVMRTAFPGVEALEATHSRDQEELLRTWAGCFVNEPAWLVKLTEFSGRTR